MQNALYLNTSLEGISRFTLTKHFQQSQRPSPCPPTEAAQKCVPHSGGSLFPRSQPGLCDLPCAPESGAGIVATARDRPLWSRSSTLTGAVRSMSFTYLYTFRSKNQNSSPMSRSLQSCFPTSSSLLPHGNICLSDNCKGEGKKTNHPQTHRQAFSKLGDSPSAPHERQQRPQSGSLTLISDMEFYSS